MKSTKVKLLATEKMERRKVCLFGGLFLLALSGVGFWIGLPYILDIVLLGAGICLKGLFLFDLFRAPDFRFSLDICLILMGVVMILISLIFKNIYPIPFVRSLLFYTAIALKISGVTLLFFNKRK